MMRGRRVQDRSGTPFRLGCSAGLAAVLIGVLSLAGCDQKAMQTAPPPPSVSVVRPTQQQVTDYLDLPGNTQAVNTVQLRARVAGYLDKVLFQDGQLVKEGQLLFVIQQNTYRSNLEQAEGAGAAAAGPT